MAGPALVGTQKNASSGAGTTLTVTLGGAITAGNMLVAIATTDDATLPGASAISDTTGTNVWTRLQTSASGTNGGSPSGTTGIYVCLNAAAGTYGIKFTNGTAFIALSVAELTPNGQTGTDGTNSASSNVSGTVNPGTITTTNADDVIFAGAVDATTTTTWTVGTGYTLLATVTSNANTNVGAQYRTFSATVSGQSTAFGNSASLCWSASAVAVKAVVTVTSLTPGPPFPGLPLPVLAM